MPVTDSARQTPLDDGYATGNATSCVPAMAMPDGRNGGERVSQHLIDGAIVRDATGSQLQRISEGLLLQPCTVGFAVSICTPECLPACFAPSLA